MQQIISKRSFYILLLFIIGLDLISSYFCYLQTPLLGDLGNIVLPSPSYSHVLNDPLGFRALLTGEKYVGPNRFFAHWLPYTYFNTVPFFFQRFTNPVDSLYISAAILKLFTQLGITALLSHWIVGKTSLLNSRYLLIFTLLSALFLASPRGYFFPMRVVDHSIIYTFAYPFSFFFVLLYLHPFVGMYQGMRSTVLRWWEHIVLFLLSFLVVFHGPINAPSAILISGLILLVLWWKQFQASNLDYSIKRFFSAIQAIPFAFLFHFIGLILLGLYSFYLGLFNAENPTTIPSLGERYVYLGQGVLKVLFQIKATPLPLIALTAIFYFSIAKNSPSKEAQKLLKSIQYIALFSLIYTLLLPLGGHRSYRSLIFRFDTMLPITCGLFVLFGATTNLLVQTLTGKRKQQLQLFLSMLALVIVLIDMNSLYPARYDCERSTFFQLSKATEEPVLIPDCTIMSWETISASPTPSNQAKLLHRWNITQRPLLYYHKK
ncbi:hypothetical protein [Aureispira anguillae]|uniref:Uncharacterized protein n=1 Tax=Aureispira anguillae TaxID=2864201 RepID=A0A915YDW8_9BACT|nr:hypothetical protein [Aureispira anguillae]BDS11236.1 hypothetical protein AsAng_0019480 [Aureispira anguillae]